MKRLAIIVSHPIQYYTPVFAALTERGTIDVKVFYTGGNDGFNRFDKGFNKVIAWDVPLLNGYEHQFLKNTSADPGTHHFNGIINPEIIADIKDYAPNAILIYGWAWNAHLKTIRHFAGKVPILFRGDSTTLNEQKGLKKLLKGVLLRWLYRKIDTFLFVGQANRAYFLEFGVPATKLVFAPHAIDNQRFSLDSSIEWRSILGIPQTAILILFAGKFEKVKSCMLLLEAFNQANIENTHLLLVGNGVMENKLKAFVRNTGTKNVHFLDFQNQAAMPSVYHACDLFCLPSRSETWGLAVNEAMAAGRAVLVSDKVGSAADLVKEGVNGSIFKSGDVADFASELARLCSSKSILTKYGQASKKIIADYSIEKQVNAIELAIINA